MCTEGNFIVEKSALGPGGSLHFIVQLCGSNRHKQLFLSFHIRRCCYVLLMEGCLWGWGLHSCNCKSGSGKRQKSGVFPQFGVF